MNVSQRLVILSVFQFVAFYSLGVLRLHFLVVFKMWLELRQATWPSVPKMKINELLLALNDSVCKAAYCAPPFGILLNADCTQ